MVLTLKFSRAERASWYPRALYKHTPDNISKTCFFTITFPVSRAKRDKIERREGLIKVQTKKDF